MEDENPIAYPIEYLLREVVKKIKSPLKTKLPFQTVWVSQ